MLDPVSPFEVEGSMIVTVDGVCLLPTTCCASDSFDDVVFVPILVSIIKYTPPCFVLLTTYVVKTYVVGTAKYILRMRTPLR